MDFTNNFDQVQRYFEKKLQDHGATPQGADWNSPNSQNIRFDQLIKVIEEQESFSILDYGCGYGALADYLYEKGYRYSQYTGFDIVESMVVKAGEIHSGREDIRFTSKVEELPLVDYAVASGVFNIRLNAAYDVWTQYTLDCLRFMHEHTRRGFSANFLTQYSDADRMEQRPDLYFADPGFLFNYCKRNFSRNVALLHDYDLYDFTLIIRKHDLG